MIFGERNAVRGEKTERYTIRGENRQRDRGRERQKESERQRQRRNMILENIIQSFLKSLKNIFLGHPVYFNQYCNPSQSNYKQVRRETRQIQRDREKEREREKESERQRQRKERNMICGERNAAREAKRER